MPVWMAEGNNLADWQGGSKKHSYNFLSKSLRAMNKALAEGLLTEVYASRDGLLQKMSPRLKLLTALAAIVLTGLSRNLYIFAGMWLLTAWLMYASHLPTFILQKRIWGFIPVVALLVSLPAMSNLVIPGTPLLMIHSSAVPIIWRNISLPADIYISQQGFLAGVILVMRVGLSISIGVLLAATTPMANLFKSLRLLGLPTVVVMITEMCYRYLTLTLNLSIEMFEARRLRTVGTLSMAAKRAQVGSSIAALFARSLSLADEIYLAMVSRGYTGQPVIWEEKTR